MGKRWVMGLVAVVAVVAAGGIGFAAFTSSAYINITVASGTLGPLYWANEQTPTSTESFDVCQQSITTFVNTSDTWNLAATNLAPGDQCTFTASLYNAGTIPANVVATFNGNIMPFCGASYTIGTPARSGPIGTAGPSSTSPIVFTVQEGMFSGLGNTWNIGGPYSCSVSIDFTATAGT